MNLKEIIHFTGTPLETINLAIRLGFTQQEFHCLNCSNICYLGSLRSSIDTYVWRCSEGKKKYSVRTNTIFSYSKLGYDYFIIFFIYFLKDTTTLIF